MMILLSRDNFRESVFKRDNHKCVVCGSAGKDAHHILERRLWPDGGYYTDNGATVCETHHIACERTDISVEEIREFAGVKKIIPPHLYDDHIYDKWGNPILPNGTRMIGELFFDESVQKILADKLHMFTYYVKYGRTHHLPWSPGITEDDRIIPHLDAFIGQEIVVTEKFDGENTSMYTDYIHARSIDGRNHPSRSWIKNFWSGIKTDIPERWRICVENMYAKHSIEYNDLPSYCIGFSVWNDKNCRLDWDDQQEWFDLLGIVPAKILYRGIYDEKILRELGDKNDWDTSEGYVVTTAKGFPYSSFKTHVGKFVRKGHVQTVKHWMHGQQIVPNKMKA